MKRARPYARPPLHCTPGREGRLCTCPFLRRFSFPVPSVHPFQGPVRWRKRPPHPFPIRSPSVLHRPPGCDRGPRGYPGAVTAEGLPELLEATELPELPEGAPSAWVRPRAPRLPGSLRGYPGACGKPVEGLWGACAGGFGRRPPPEVLHRHPTRPPTSYPQPRPPRKPCKQAPARGVCGKPRGPYYGWGSVLAGGSPTRATDPLRGFGVSGYPAFRLSRWQ